jgi:hypothetical protein
MATSPLDLTTIAAVKSWLSQNGTASSQTTDDANIQLCITSASVYWLYKLGLQDGDVTADTESPLVQPVSYSESYNGNGKNQLFLRKRPIQSVASLQIWNAVIPQCPPGPTGINTAGWLISDDKKSLYLRNGAYGFANTPMPFSGFGRWCFAKGLQNIFVTYSAGFTSTPPDIELAAIQMVGTNYSRKKWIDQKSQQMANGAGTITYRDWELQPEVLACMNRYKRFAVTT